MKHRNGTKIAGLFLAIMMVLSVAGGAFANGQQEEAAPEQAQGDDSDKLLIAYAPPTYDASDFWGKLGSNIEAELDVRGEDYEFVVRAPETHASHAQQFSIVRDFINMGVDYILMGPTELYAQMGAYEAINNAGIPIVILNWTVPFEDEDVDILSWVGYSQAYGGELAGEWIANWFHENHDGEGELAIIYGNPGSLTEDRWSKTAQPIIEDLAPGVEVVYEGGAEYDRIKSYNVTQNIITGYPDVDFIYSMSSAQAVGSVEATLGADRGDIGVMGYGGTDEEVMAIWEGRQTATVFRGEYDVAYGAVEAILNHRDGKNVVEVYETAMGILDGREAILNLLEDYRLEELGLE